MDRSQQPARSATIGAHQDLQREHSPQQFSPRVARTTSPTFARRMRNAPRQRPRHGAVDLAVIAATDRHVDPVLTITLVSTRTAKALLPHRRHHLRSDPSRRRQHSVIRHQMPPAAAAPGDSPQPPAIRRSGTAARVDRDRAVRSPRCVQREPITLRTQRALHERRHDTGSPHAHIAFASSLPHFTVIVRSAPTANISLCSVPAFTWIVPRMPWGRNSGRSRQPSGPELGSAT